MRLWSIHPSYLDSKGLVACWRESLLAQEVLKGNTKGYKNHPQLIRFKTSKNPLGFIGQYLVQIAKEAYFRGYNFKYEKIFRPITEGTDFLEVTKWQLEYEFQHLQKKLYDRCKITWEDNFNDIYVNHKEIQPHPLFKVIECDVESWEKRKEE